MVGFADLLNPVGGFSPRPTSVPSVPKLAHPAHRPVTGSSPLSITTHTRIPSESIYSHASALLSPPSSSSASSSPAPTDDAPSVSMLLEMEDHPPRKIQFHLFQDHVPRTCNFFRALSAPDLRTSSVVTTNNDNDPLVTFNLPPRTACAPAIPSPVPTALGLPGLTGETLGSAPVDEMRIEVNSDRAWMVGLTKTASGGAQVVIHLSSPFDTPSALSTLPLPLPPPSSPSSPTTLTTHLVYFAQVLDTPSQHALLAAHRDVRPVHITSFEAATPAPDTFIEPSCLKSQRSESPTMSKMTADSPTSEDLSTSETSRASTCPSSSGRSSSSVGTEKRGRPWGDSWMTVEDLELHRVALTGRKRKVLVRRKKVVNTSPTSVNHPVVNPPVGERRWGPSWTDGAAVAEEEVLVVEWVDIDEDTPQQQMPQRPEGAEPQVAPISPTVKQEGQTPMPTSPAALPATLNNFAFIMAAEDKGIRATKRRKWSIAAEPSSAPVQTSTVRYPMPDPVLPQSAASSTTTGSCSPRDVGAAQPRTLAAERVSIRGLLSGGRDGPLPDLAFPRLSTASTHSPSRFTNSPFPTSTSGHGWSFIGSNNMSPPVRKPSISAPQVPNSLPTYHQRSTSDRHLSRQFSTKVPGPSRMSCLGSAVYPQSVSNRHGTVRDRLATSRSSTNTSRTSHGQEPVYQQQQYDYPHRNRYEHQFQVSLCPTPHEEMEQMRISNTGDNGGLRIEQYNPYEYGGRRQRRRNTTAGQETPVASASSATHTRRPSGSGQQQQLAYSSQAQAQTVQAALPIPQPLIYLPPSSPEASNSRQPLIRKRKHDALAVPLAAR